MIVLQFKLKGKAQQYRVIDEMVRTAQLVRNKTLKYWIHNQGVKLVDLYKQCAIMAKEFQWVDLTRWRVKLLLNMPFLLSNVFSLIAKPRNQGKKATRSLKNTLAP